MSYPAKSLTAFISSCLLYFNVAGQALTGNEYTDPSIPPLGNVEPRSEFISYSIRDHAEKRNKEANAHYLPLTMEKLTTNSGRTVYTTDVDIPYMWLDRDVFIQISGIPTYYVSAGNKLIGYGGDSRTPMQFLLSGNITDGVNTISVLKVEGTGESMEANNTGTAPEPEFFIFSQPKVRVENFRIDFFPDTAGNRGILDLRLYLSNSYNSKESITVGYDIYTPQGKLLYYDFKEVEIPGQGRDTLRFWESLEDVDRNKWSNASPALYYGLITVRRGGRMTEYIPYNIGYRTITYGNGTVSVNGSVVDIKAVRYNSPSDQFLAEKQLAELKSKGFNTICPDHPQPLWFYDACNKLGMYVIDQVDNNSSSKEDNRKVGGGLGNDPAWLPVYLSRAAVEMARVRNYSCIIGWSVGGNTGNGYNMYHTYLWMKDADPKRPVIFKDAAREWNSDIHNIEVSEYSFN